MKTVPLVVKDIGIYPANRADRNAELRARTFLAYGYENKLIKPWALNHPGGTLVLLDIDKLEMFEANELNALHPINTGIIYVPDVENAGFNEQSGRMVLYIDSSTIDLNTVLENYFKSSVRWLNDNPGAAKAIQQAYERANR